MLENEARTSGWRESFPFKRHYAAYTIEELPGRPPDRSGPFYFPAGTTRGGRDGVIIEIAAENSEPWIGVFAFGGFKDLPSGLVGSPNPDELFVITHGVGYRVDVMNRTADDVEAIPVRQVYPLRDHNLVVFVDFTTLTAYGSCGVAWQREHLVSDDLEITSISNEQIRGRGWDAPRAAMRDFALEIATGEPSYL
jgi:hypothetical protein